ncbi:hypothetical protein R3W88_026876 [Solanum pinnatisectum]|uniref:DUF4283 domain-containing protein n=1 Tax=Solanum pinnatisectum TaxID=50273 RepID=A0AAV9LFM7_9SOLN|nr:hypothetical protein R3W88_026876 [Solanum pinnatisectum]
MATILHGGPWFILNYFLLARKWEPKFVASSAQLSYSAIWVRLLDLPSKFYDDEIPSRVGNILGKLLKIDTCTSSTTSGKYACINGGVPLEQPLKSHIYISDHRQTVLYKGLNILCTSYRRLGHTKLFVHTPKCLHQRHKIWI